jgi:Spy/CpxP family protein refolding chaperone
MKSKWIVIAAVLAMAGVSMAEDKPAGDPPKRERREGGPGDRRGGPLGGLIEKLNLTEEQKPKVKAIMEEHRAAAEKYREEHKAEFEAARAKMKEARESKDEAKIKEAREAFRKLMEGGPSLKELGDKLRAVLTADQQKVLDEELAKIKERMANGPGPGGPRGERKPGDKKPD